MRKIFTQEQIDNLLSNPNVESCGDRSITYTTTFKQQAVKLYEKGFTSTEIFKQAGMSLEVIGDDKPKDCLKRWRKIVRKKGIEGLKESRGQNGAGGGRPKTTWATEVDKIKYLEAQVAYLKAENAFLTKLRAKRKE